MKIPLSWLKSYLDSEASLEQIAAKLNLIGLEVEAISSADDLAPFITARILEVTAHPDADNLHILKVDSGQEILQIICGAPNVRKNMVSVLAKPNDYLKALDITLIEREIRGVMSYGMLCSPEELGLSDMLAYYKAAYRPSEQSAQNASPSLNGPEAVMDGIIDLGDNAPIGVNFADYMGLSDPIIEVSITPNRSDCASIYGIARDLAASGLGSLKDLKEATLAPFYADYANAFSAAKNAPKSAAELTINKTKSANNIISLADEAQSGCQGFYHRLITDVANRPSPWWLARLLLAAGLRPVNLLVDISNYLTIAIGAPLHIFDADYIKNGAQITLSKQGQEFYALNGKNYQLSDGQLIISQKEEVLSLCGIMGGKDSGCQLTSRNILIEAALWQPAAIAKTGRDLGIVSDARYRFERGVDPYLMEIALELASEIILRAAGGTAQETICLKKISYEPKTIIFPLREVKRLTGLDLSSEIISAILQKLGCQIIETTGQGEEGELTIIPPSWRYDLNLKVDLVEEVLRIYGIDKIEPQPLPQSTSQYNILTLEQRYRHIASRILASRAMCETINWSFIGENLAQAFRAKSPLIALANPIAKNMSHMRPNLLPGLLSSAARNKAHFIHDISFFEIGHSYKGLQPEDQHLELAAIRLGETGGQKRGRSWRNKTILDIYDVKEDLCAVIEALGIKLPSLSFKAQAAPWYHPSRSATLLYGDIILGYFGAIHPRIASLFKLKGSIFAFELYFANIKKLPRQLFGKDKAPLNLAKLHPVYRDFCFILDKEQTGQEVMEAAREAAPQLIEKISIFDIFENPAQKDKKSIAIEIIMQPQGKSLTESELEEISQKIISNICLKTGALLR